MDNKEEFLKEFEALVRKHKIIVSGCGCCDSPFLESESDLYKFKDDIFENDNPDHIEEGIKGYIKHLSDSM